MNRPDCPQGTAQAGVADLGKSRYLDPLACLNQEAGDHARLRPRIGLIVMGLRSRQHVEAAAASRNVLGAPWPVMVAAG